MINNKSLRLITTSVFLFYSLLTTAQQRFEPGYYVDTSGNRIECQIEQKQWITWSNDFVSVKIDGAPARIPINNLVEFGIPNKLKFITAKVFVDKSVDILDQLDYDSEPNLVESNVLLKVLIEGDVSLYLYLNQNVRKYFFRKGDDEFKQLIYKRYIKEEGARTLVLENNEYVKQLQSELYCSEIDYKKLRYERNDLMKYIIAYSNCTDQNIEFSSKRTLKAVFRVNPFAGFNYNIVKVNRANADFNLNSIDPTFGIEFNYLLPLIINDFGITLSAMYNKASNDENIEFPNSSTVRNVTLDYSELLVGLTGTYRIYTSNNNTINLGGGFYYPILLEDTRYTESLSLIDLEQNNTGVTGGILFGINLNRFNVHAQYIFSTEALSDTNDFDVSVSRLTIRLGYFL